MESVLALVCISAMVSASYFDVMWREVPDTHWWVIGVSGILSYLTSGIDISSILMAIGSLLFLVEMLTDLDLGNRALVLYYAAASSFFIAAMSVDDGSMMACVSIPLCICMFRILYVTGILKGGADAKSLMALSIALPVRPTCLSVIQGMDAMGMFPMSLLLLASVMTVASAIPIAVRNIIAERDMTLRNLVMMRKDIDDVVPTHMWIGQDVIDGEVRYVKDADVSALDRLKEHGADNVWVSPIVPFMVPITIALVFELAIMDPLSFVFTF